LARDGLARRARRDEEGRDETRYLAPIEETLALRKTPAERWLDRYYGEWQCDLTHIFDEAEI
jgi:glutamate--cysteine ligase